MVGTKRYRGRTTMWHFRICALAIAVTMTPRLPAQTPESIEQIPVIPGSRHDTKGEALLPRGGDSNRVRLYRIAASIEEVFKWYHYELGGESGDVLDSPTVAVKGISSVRYHVEFHRFTDVCADSTRDSAQAADSTTCHQWLRGKSKRRAIALSRLAWDRDQWIAAATFTWFCRDPDGTLHRLRVAIRDIGLKPDWSYYTPLGEVRIESVALDAPPP
jgi:hypothetical protein